MPTYSDKDKKFLKALKDQGVSAEEAFARLEKVKQQIAEKETQQPSGDYFGKGLVEFGAGAVAQTPQIGANLGAATFETLKQIPGAGMGFQASEEINKIGQQARAMASGQVKPQDIYTMPISSIPEQMSGGGREATSWLKGMMRKGGVETENLPGIAGGITADVLASLALASRGKGLQGILPKVGKGASVLQKLIAGTPKSLAMTSLATGVTEGKLPDPTAATVGGAIDIVIPGLGKVVGKKLKSLGSWVYSNLGNKVEAATIQQLDRNVASALEQGLTGGRRAVVRKAEQAVQSSGQKLNNLLNKSKVKTDPNKLINTAVDSAVAAEQAGDAVKAKALMKLVENFRSVNPAKLSPKQVLKLKRYAAEEILPNLKSADLGKASISAKKMFYEHIWKNADNVLSGMSPEVKKLNQNMSAAYSVLVPAKRAVVSGGGRLPEGLYSEIKKLVTAPSITTRAGSAGYKLGKALETKQGQKLAQILKTFNVGDNTLPQILKTLATGKK